jgi:flagellar hook-associated protein 2
MIGDTEIAIDNDSLSSLRDKINAANTGDNPSGVAASIINDGNGFRLVLTGTDASKPFTVSMTDGVTAEGYEPLAFSTTQTQSLATIVVDGITITSGSNTFENAIPGVTLTVTKPHATPGDSTSLTVETDRDAVKTKIKDLVTAYNSIMSFISEQKTSDWGRDSSLTGVRRNLQGMLTTSIAGSDSFATLSQLGLKTQRDGTLAIDNTVLRQGHRPGLGRHRPSAGRHRWNRWCSSKFYQLSEAGYRPGHRLGRNPPGRHRPNPKNHWRQYFATGSAPGKTGDHAAGPIYRHGEDGQQP